MEEEAAIVGFEAEVDGRLIQSKVQEKAQAEAEYERGLEQKKTSILLTEETPDIFQIKLGHLPPGAGARVRITYLSELPVEEHKICLTIPTTVAPRYVPANDTSEEAKRISSIDHDFSSPVQMSLDLEVLLKSRIVAVTSPSHALTLLQKSRVQEYDV